VPQFAVENKGTADALAQSRVEEIIAPAASPETIFAPGRGISVVLDDGRHTRRLF
jgi:hypothetical protein